MGEGYFISGLLLNKRNREGSEGPLDGRKYIEVRSGSLGLKKKRFIIGTNAEKHLEQIVNL